jgi:hypothetical protein
LGSSSVSANSLCGVLDEVVEGISYRGRAGTHLSTVSGSVHDAGFVEDPASLGDELGVSDWEQKTVDRLTGHAAQALAFEPCGLVVEAFRFFVFAPPPVLLGAYELGDGCGV